MTSPSCPRCHGLLLPDGLDGSFCINCGYVQYQGPGLGVSAATMSQPPGLTAETPLERYEDGRAEATKSHRGSYSATWWQRRKDKQRIEDEALGQAVARRLGVTLEDLQSNAQDAPSRERRREAIVELRSLGLSCYQIGNLLDTKAERVRAVLVKEKRAQG